MPGPLAPFDDAVLDAVAEEQGLDAAALRDLVERHQRYVRDMDAVGGVDGLVYEWRQSLFEDPLAEGDPAVYYLAVPGRVWRDFGERMALADEELTALRAVHDRQFRATVGDPEGQAMVLSKTG